MMGIFCQAAVSDFCKSKDSFHDPEGMLYLGAHFRFPAVARTLLVTQLTVTATFLLGKVFGLRRIFSNGLFLSRSQLFNTNVAESGVN
jgi:hypothetical protein